MSRTRVEASLRSEVVEATIDAIFVTTADGLVEDANPAAERLVGRPLGDLIGTPFASLVATSGGRAGDPATVDLRDGVAAMAGTVRELLLQHHDDRSVPVEMSVSLLSAGEHVRFACIARDVSRRKHAEEELVHRASVDELTGVGNRVAMHRALARALSNTDQGWRFAVLFLDLDGFKFINDTHGHAFGDAVLREAAARLAGAMRHDDVLARFGGDEFVVVLESAGDVEADAHAVAARVRAVFHDPVVIDDTTTQLRISIGTATYPADGRTVGQVLHSADAAMYASRRRA